MRYYVCFDVIVTTARRVVVEGESPEDAIYKATQCGDGRQLEERHKEREIKDARAVPSD